MNCPGCNNWSTNYLAAHEDYAYVGYDIVLPAELILLISRDSEKLGGSVEQRLGYYGTHA